MNKFIDLNSINLVETRLVFKRKDSIILKHCGINEIETVK